MALLQPWRYARCIPHLQRSLKVINKVRANVQPKKRLGSTLHAPCEDVPDFGDYSVVLPPEPFVFGVSHIKPRPVPPHIPKPPYAGISRVAENEPDSYEGDGGLRSGKRERIALGGESEFRIREAAKLAKKVRVYAGSLVQVCAFVYLTRIVKVLTIPISVRNMKGWRNDRHHRRGCSRVYHRSRCLPFSTSLFWFSALLLYKASSSSSSTTFINDMNGILA